MLAAAGSVVALVAPIFSILIAIVIARAVLRVARRGARLLRGSIVVRDGHAALSDEARASIEKRGLNVAKMERLVDKTYTVDERGEIVTRGERTGASTSVSPTPGTGRDAAEPDRPLYRKPSVEDLLGRRSSK